MKSYLCTGNRQISVTGSATKPRYVFQTVQLNSAAYSYSPDKSITFPNTGQHFAKLP